MVAAFTILINSFTFLNDLRFVYCDIYGVFVFIFDAFIIIVVDIIVIIVIIDIIDIIAVDFAIVVILVHLV